MRFIIGLVGGCLLGIWAEAKVETICVKRAYPEAWHEVISDINREANSWGNEISSNMISKLETVIAK